MKRCPECRRDYYDDSLLYCLDDGNALLEGPASMDEPATAILTPQTQMSGARNSVAVLPFVNISGDPDNEYFCDGLAEELLNALAKIDDLRVAARTSAFSFKGRNVGAREIGKSLDVNTVLEGSVRKVGNRIRINVQLINAADGYHLWSERYDRQLDDIFDVQDEIAMAVVARLKIQLLGSEKAALLKRHTQSTEAHEFYLRGLSHFNKWTPADFHKAIENFERAIAIDPNYASAYAGLADAHTELSFFSFAWVNAGPKARDAAAKALQLDDSLAEVHNSAALIKMYFDWDYGGAEHEFKRAVTLNPGSASVHMWYGWYLALMERFDEALKKLQDARELDPLSPPNINAIGVIFHWSRQTERAIAQFQKVLELYPKYTITLSFLAEAYGLKGDIASAIRTVEQIEPAAMDPQALSVAGYFYARSGNSDKALAILKEFEERSGHEHLPAINFAHIYAGMGDKEQAFAWLEKACDDRVAWIPFLKVDVKFDSLRSDPRFKVLLSKAGFVK